MTVYAKPGTEGSVMSFEGRYENWIGGKWVPPVKGQYFENPSPVDGQVFCEVARSTAEDIDLALDAAHAAAPAWGKTSVAERSLILLRIADRIEDAGLTIAHQRDGCGRKNTAEGQILCHLSQIRRVSHEFFR